MTENAWLIEKADNVKHAWAAFRGTVGRLVLRVLARVAEDTWIKRESLVTKARAKHREATDRLARYRRAANEAREAHCRWQQRLSQNNVLTVSGGREKTNGQ